MRSADEERMVEAGIARARLRRARAISSRQEARHGATRRLATEATSILARAVERWAAPGPGKGAHRGLPLLNAVGFEIAAHYAVQTALNAVSRTQNCGDVVRAIGRALEVEVRMAALERNDRRAWEYVTEVSRGRKALQARMHRDAALRRAGLRDLRIARDLKVRSAWVLLELLTRETGIFVIQTVSRTGYRGKPRQERILVPHGDTIAWLEAAHLRAEQRAVVHRPLSEPPRPWGEDLAWSGYHSEALRYDLVKDLQSARGHERRAPAVARAANLLQGTAWRVNRRVLEVAAEVWERGLEAPGMPRPEKVPKPPFPPEGTEEAEVRGWRREVAMLHRADERRMRQRLRTASSLAAARELAELERFHFPMRADFRGRLYPRCPGLSWVGADVERGLLEFAEAEPWAAGDAEPYGWLARRLASSWGLSRASYAERERWVGAHRAEILEVAERPVETLAWWSTAKEPWQFLAGCFAWRDLVRGEGDAHLHLPVAIDASNNAVQIYSLLMRDAELARSTNVVASEGPQDAYSEIAARVTQRCEEAVSAMGRSWLAHFGGAVPRDVCKAVLVGLVYGAHAQGLVKAVLTWYEELPTWPFGARAAFPFCRWLAWEIHHTLREYTPGTFETLKWLRGVGRTCAKGGWPAVWTSPSGFEVVQDHRKAQNRRVVTMIGEVVREEPLAKDTDRPDAQMQARSLPPNFVHSLDAAVLHLALGKLEERGVGAVATAHDAFAVHAAHVGTLHRTLRETYAEVFATDLLGELHAEMVRRTGLAFDAPPTGGELDPAAVRESAYLFS